MSQAVACAIHNLDRLKQSSKLCLQWILDHDSIHGKHLPTINGTSSRL
jgi:hypothetical protein